MKNESKNKSVYIFVQCMKTTPSIFPYFHNATDVTAGLICESISLHCKSQSTKRYIMLATGQKDK